MRPGRYAVVPTRNRPYELGACVNAIGRQVDLVIIIDNGSEPPAAPPMADLPHLIIRDPQQPPNLSRLWNVGLAAAAEMAKEAGHDTWDVAVLNDDAVVPPGWLDACSQAIRCSIATLACSEWLCGWAFVLRGEAGLQADERLRWWYGDDDLYVQAELAGGTVVVPGFPVEHLHPDESTVGVLAVQAGLDRQTYIDKWNMPPW